LPRPGTLFLPVVDKTDVLFYASAVQLFRSAKSLEIQGSRGWRLRQAAVRRSKGKPNLRRLRRIEAATAGQSKQTSRLLGCGTPVPALWVRHGPSDACQHGSGSRGESRFPARAVAGSGDPAVLPLRHQLVGVDAIVAAARNGEDDLYHAFARRTAWSRRFLEREGRNWRTWFLNEIDGPGASARERLARIGPTLKLWFSREDFSAAPSSMRSASPTRRTTACARSPSP